LVSKTLNPKFKNFLLKVPGVKLLKLLKERIINLSIFLDSRRFNKTLNVNYSGKPIFKIMDFGQLCKMRARTFEYKEPETIEWIESFEKNEKLLDVGANVGIYSLFAASLGIKVLAIEPEALNYAMLNLNIRVNNFNSLIKAFCISLHNKNIVDYLNISASRADWGAAQNNFNNNIDWTGKRTFDPVHVQGSSGMTVDYFLNNISHEINHIKIDVDGNEFLITQGAKETFNSRFLKSVLIELDEGRDDYEDTIKLIKKYNFELTYKGHAPVYNTGRFSNVYNHIFKKIH
tara:strand:- start:7012 stop:7878 length:867 start_codon:yes stop_codon:yes gene_type:complete